MPKPKKQPPQPVRDLFDGLSPAPLVVAHKRRRRRGGSDWTPSRQRLAEIVRLVEHRHGGACDTDGEGETYLWAAVPALIEMAGRLHEKGAASVIRDWAFRVTPKVGRAEVERIIAEAEERADRQQMHLSAQDVGEEVRLTLQERDGLEIRTIRPAGMTERQFQEFRRSRRAANSRTARAANGAKSREESKARTKPWGAMTPPISRSTYYRHGLHKPDALNAYLADRKAGETNSWPLDPKDLQQGTNPSQLRPDQTLAGPAMKASARQNVGADGPSAGARMVRVEAGRDVAPALPGGDDGQQGELLNCPSAHAERALELMAKTAWEGGPIPHDVRLAVRDALHAYGVTHAELGQAIGLTRMSVTNILRPRGVDGLSSDAAEALKQFLRQLTGVG